MMNRKHAWEQRAAASLLSVVLALGGVPLPARAESQGGPEAQEAIESPPEEGQPGLVADSSVTSANGETSPEVLEEDGDASELLDITDDPSAIEVYDEPASFDDEPDVLVDSTELDILEQPLTGNAEEHAVEETAALGEQTSVALAGATPEASTPQASALEVEADKNALGGTDGSTDQAGLEAMSSSKKRDISKATVAKLATQPYTGKPLHPSPKVTWRGKRLAAGKDYTVSYRDNVYAGQATIAIRGRGSYTGILRAHFSIVAPSVAYYSHVQGSGWEHPWFKKNGFVSGTTGQSKRIEALRIKLVRKPVSGSIRYRAHVQGIGWEHGWKTNGATSGTTGQSKRLEAIQIKLSGKMAKLYDVQYRVHAQHFGWMAWTKNGKPAGSQGFAYRLEALQIRVVPKGTKLPTSMKDTMAFVGFYPEGKTGWQNPAKYPQVSPNSVTLPSYCTGYHTYVTPSRIPANATRAQCVEAFISRAYEYLGTPYREPWAREPGVGCDCSGLVLQCLYATGMDLEHARGTEKVGGYNPYNHFWVPNQTYNSTRWFENKTFKPVSLSKIRRGDLVFYSGHVAIYLGNGRIIDTVAGRGCAITEYSAKGVVGAQRPFV
ncbi:MAG: C40 family peptidase [Atopobiaceae bacterium]|nr:C40 family peptidase [Atopobiaceae bacterium]